jgi:hypothetical protein
MKQSSEVVEIFLIWLQAHILDQIRKMGEGACTNVPWLEICQPSILPKGPVSAVLSMS